MTVLSCRGATLLTLLAAAALVSAQITFSRDWTGGKRSAPQLALDCEQFSTVCRHFIHELKQAMSTQIDRKPHRRTIEDTPILYDEDN
ncbi:uncharacterized protein LOC105395855 [Plutella xylostella]|uniref:uncharacterized protein LOC105395855 n=1 Tax=Plutella xylostella TaxID=51655 RepID=UPI0020329775|nr:uncharacterized protein LOC105395855 [Plutella xylostella]